MLNVYTGAQLHFYSILNTNSTIEKTDLVQIKATDRRSHEEANFISILKPIMLHKHCFSSEVSHAHSVVLAKLQLVAKQLRVCTTENDIF